MLFLTIDARGAKFPPSFTWQTIETEHFRITFHKKHAALGRKTARMAEEIHVKLKKERWTPWRKTDIILTDHTDTANGYASSFPHNRIVIYLSRPRVDSSLNHFDDWLYLVLIHEYTHILNIDKITGVPAITRYFPGRIYFLNGIQPIWMIEGNAVFNESMGGFGRNNSAYGDMILRLEYLSGENLSLGLSSHYIRKWPGGNVPYLNGGAFARYLEERFGPGTMAALYHANSNNIIPFLNNMNAKDVTGFTFERLWKDWQKTLAEKYDKQMASVKRAGLTEVKIVSPQGVYGILPVFSPQGDLFYVDRSPTVGTRLMKYSVNTGKSSFLTNVNNPVGLDFDEKGAVIVADMERYRSFNLVNDLHRFTNGRYKRITFNRRIKSFSYSRDKKYRAEVTVKDDRYTLLLIDTESLESRKLIENSSRQISDPVFSPNGRELAFSFRDREGDVDLALITLATGSVVRYVRKKSHDIQPVWTEEGKNIIFASDETGIFNLYVLDIETGDTRRFTNILGGCFDPALSQGKVAFQYYTPRGPVIGLVDFPGKVYGRGKAYKVPLEKDFFLSKEEEPEHYTEKTYNPFLSLWPVYILPSYSFNRIAGDLCNHIIGFSLKGHDTLEHHWWSFAFTGSPIRKNLSFDVSYTYTGLYPDIGISYYDNTLLTEPDPFPEAGTGVSSSRRLGRSGEAFITIPFLGYNFSNYLGVSYSFKEIFYRAYSTTTGFSSDHSILSGFSLVYKYSDARLFTWSVAPERGRTFRLAGDIYHQALGSDYSFYRAGFRYKEYLPGFAPNNTFNITIAGGAWFDRPAVIAGFDLGALSMGSISFSSSSASYPSLRGYPSGVIQGDYLIYGSLEYVLPVVQIDAASGTFPVMFRDLWFRFFTEYGGVWSGAPGWGDFKPSIGIEMNLNLTLAYYADVTFMVGYAYGFLQPGEHQVYFAITGLLDALLMKKERGIDFHQKEFFR